MSAVLKVLGKLIIPSLVHNTRPLLTEQTGMEGQLSELNPIERSSRQR